MSEQRGLLREGFERVWHYQRVVWWLFFVNLFLAFIGAWPLTARMHEVTDHSLRTGRLADTFDYGDFSALSSNPEVNLFAGHGSSIHYSFVFFFFVLFLTGGILEAYRSGRKLTTREFFEACGNYFWRFVRLLILMVIVVAPVSVGAILVLGKTGDWLFLSGAAQEIVGLWKLAGGLTVAGFLLMCIRFWFDMAQVRAVVEEESGMIRNAGRAFKITFSNFGSLFWMYFRISVLGWLVFAAGVYIWLKMPPSRFGTTFLVLEFVILFGFGVRLWQRACEVVWYQRRLLAQVVAVPPSPPAPDPLLTITPASVPPTEA